MTAKHVASTAMRGLTHGTFIHRGVSARNWKPILANAQTARSTSSRDSETTTPIKHVIVIIGENRTFDHIFATYVPQRAKQSGIFFLREL